MASQDNEELDGSGILLKIPENNDERVSKDLYVEINSVAKTAKENIFQK